MGIILNSGTRVLVQGITGREGRFHTVKMKEYGTAVVAGVTPGKGGLSVEGIPVFNTVGRAVTETGAEASVIFVPPHVAADSILESIMAGIRTIVCISEGIPVQDMLKVKDMAEETGTILIGPNCPGLINPGEAMMGILPGDIFRKGNIGIISRSGTLTYEVVGELTRAGLGQSTCVGIGGDPVTGTSFKEMLKLFREDPETKMVLCIGEIGGSGEEEAVEWLKENPMKIAAFIAGRTAPAGKRMGHAGAIVSGSSGTAQAKIEAFAKIGVKVSDTIPEMVQRAKEIIMNN